MDMPTYGWWIERVGQLEKERNEWITIAQRLANQYHDANCEFAAPCSYCDAMKKATKK
jgi:hypothetical protein